MGTAGNTSLAANIQTAAKDLLKQATGREDANLVNLNRKDLESAINWAIEQLK